MNVPWRNIVALSITLSIAAAQSSCYFDFEDPSELTNFDVKCDGTQGNWSIVASPNVPSDYDTGNSVLTSQAQQKACLKTVKMIDLQEQQTIEILYFEKFESYSASATLEITLVKCSDAPSWSVIDPTTVRPNENGEWRLANHTFTTTPNSKCEVQIVMYLNGATVGVDKLVVKDPVSSENCYVVEKPTTTEASTTRDTTTEARTTRDTTTEARTTRDTTTEATTPTDTTEETTITDTITDATTPTDTTEETTTTDTTEETTTTDATTGAITTTETTTTDITEETPTTTTDTTTKTSESSTQEATATTEPTTEETTATSQSPTQKTTTTMEPITEETTARTEPNDNVTSIPTPNPTTGSEYPDFAMFYWVIVIASSGGVAILSVCLCQIILRTKGPNRNVRKKTNSFRKKFNIA